MGIHGNLCRADDVAMDWRKNVEVRISEMHVA